MDSSFLRTRLLEGGLPSPTLIKMDTVLDIVAGGWSFHAITASNVKVWGTMDGQDFAPPGDLTLPGAVVGEPITLPGSEGLGIVSIRAGRRHSIALNSKSEVFEYFAFGGMYQVLSESWGNERVVSIEAGWDCSAVLMSSGSVFIWSEFEQEEDIVARPGALPLVTASTIRLPSVPSSDKVIKIACGVNFIIALTEQSHVYYLDISRVTPGRIFVRMARLEAAFDSGERNWILLDRFSDLFKVQALPAFANIAISSAARITHISAHFHSFAAYSVPIDTTASSDSIVLLGDDDNVTSDKAPQVIPELQGIGVIKIVQGDYTFGALTSNGRLRTWGQYSAGALGLGHPSLLNTPLTHPSLRSPAPTPPAQSSSESNLYPLPQITPRLPIAPVIHYRASEVVEKPTVVLFGKEAAPVEGQQENSRNTGKFVVNATMSGWHAAAIAVELGETEEEEEVVEEALVSQGEATPGLTTGIFPTMRGGRLPFRLGYAARGMHRGLGDRVE